jgi:hypothetical protein
VHNIATATVFKGAIALPDLTRFGEIARSFLVVQVVLVPIQVSRVLVLVFSLE